MASLEQHKHDCLRWLGNDCEQLNVWMDKYFAQHGSAHRKFRHHKEGIEEARMLFGELGAQAALIHVLRDCRHVPTAQDYVSGAVDVLGLKKTWPVAAYVHYTEEAFAALVQHKLHGPTGILLWAFIGQEIAPLLPTLTRLMPEEVKSALPKWEAAVKHRNELPPLDATDAGFEEFRPEGDLKVYLDRLSQLPALAQMATQHGGIQFGRIAIDSLITPLALVDYEYVEELRPELQGDDVQSLVKFALPESVTLPVQVSVDAVRRSLTFVSGQKTLMVTGANVQQTSDGSLEVRFIVTNAATMISVSRVGDRYLLKSGIHRAFLLKSIGVSKVPCILMQESQFLPLSSAYPSFSPNVLSHPRPPLLRDFLDETLSLTVPLQRTHKLIRIVAEDFVIPVS